MDGTVRSEPGVKINLKNTTTTEANDMYFGGVCVSGLYNDVFSIGDKRIGNVCWKNYVMWIITFYFTLVF